VSEIKLKNIHMTAEDFHRACYTGLALRITRKLKLPRQDFDNIPIEEIDKFVGKYSDCL
jgi:hypothetical protein